MAGRLRRFVLLPKRYPFRFLLAASLLGVAGYLLWQITPAARFRREHAEALRALAEFDFDQARRHLDECIRLRPDDPNVRLLASQAARRDGDMIAASQHLGDYHQFFDAVTPEEHLEWSLQQAQVGKFANVVQFLLECLEVRHPASERIMEALALGCVHVYNLDLANFWAKQMLDKYPRNPVVRLIRIQTAVTLGRREGMQSELQELVAEFPRYAQARQQFADVLFAVREFDGAAKEYETLLGQLPGKLKPLLGLARSRIAAGRTDIARHLLKQLQEEFGDQSEVLLECGRFALQEKRLVDAENLLRRTLDMAPFDHEAHLELGICLEQLGKTGESQTHVAKAKQIEADLLLLEKAKEAVVKAPIDPKPRLQAGQICLRNGQALEGLRWLYGTLERNPDHKPTHRVLAEFYASLGDTQQAELHRRKAR